jgi:hypothetical protein
MLVPVERPEGGMARKWLAQAWLEANSRLEAGAGPIGRSGRNLSEMRSTVQNEISR